MSSLPTHVWTIILILQDYAWVAERNNSWDAIGVGAYGLLIAFGEGLCVFGVILFLSLLVSKAWNEDQRIALLSSLIILASIWGMINQLYFLSDVEIPESIFILLINASRPLRFIYAISLFITSVTIVLPVYFILKSEKVLRASLNIIERLSLLMTLYLVLDLGALVVVLIRNL
ncbi:MAG: hypothetical protein ISR58_20455 [Anaerolineales bacterium]|nr:hypothetical protein [Chloroflexota bacterium]MBL6983560.1 hypothetical protein [Anaerolineales bacterium]